MTQRIELLRRVGDGVLRLNRVSRSTVSHALRESGSSVPEYAVLFRLARDGEARQAELVVDAAADAPAVSRLLRRMADDGLVVIRQDPSDRRQRLVRLTKQGRGREQALAPAVDAAMLEALDGLTNAQARELARLLDLAAAKSVTGL